MITLGGDTKVYGGGVIYIMSIEDKYAFVHNTDSKMQGIGIKEESIMVLSTNIKMYHLVR